MSESRNASEISGNMSGRSLSGIPEVEAIRVGVDLVSAARRNLGFLRTVAEAQWLHVESTVVEAIRRSQQRSLGFLLK